MPCRLAVRPAPIDQYLWITDEVVTQAWNRFLRVSSTHHHHHKSGRRYGSRVPGPLEAHRRLARRRMGVSAVGAGVQGGGADFGALFGFGGYAGRPVDPRTDLKWKPPGVEKVKKEEHWMFPKSAKRKVDIFDTLLATEEEVDVVDASRAAFDELLEQQDAKETKVLVQKGTLELVPEDLEHVFAFLQSTKDEPKANNTLRLCEWMAKRPTSRATYQALARLLVDKIRLRTLDEDDVSHMLAVLMTFEKKKMADVASILDAMPHEMIQNVACTVTRTIYQNSPSNYTPSNELFEWLLCLRRSWTFRTGSSRDTWHRVHQVLASCFVNPAMLTHHLRRFNESNLCDILLDHWVARVPPRKTIDCSVLRAPSARVFRFMAERPDIQAIRATYTTLRNTKSATRLGNTRYWACTINLLHALNQHRVSHTPIAMAMFAILRQGQGAPTMFAIFRQLQTHPTVGVPHALPARLIRHLLESKSKVGLAYASRVFLSCPWVPLSSFLDLPLRLARVGKAGATALWSMLGRQTPEDHVPRKNRRQQTNRLSIDHARLVHQVALEIANCQKIRPRVAYRRVWECYRFLCDRGVYIQPIMTSAMVTSGILRYLQEFKRPAEAQVRYILRIVKSVEGEEVAMKLDRVVWVLWKKDVLPEVKARWREHIARVRNGLETAVEEISGGRRFDPGPKWAKKSRAPRGDKDQRIAAARQDWGIAIKQSVHTPVDTIYLSLGDLARRSTGYIEQTHASASANSVSPPLPAATAAAPQIPDMSEPRKMPSNPFKHQGAIQTTTWQRAGLGYDKASTLPTAAVAPQAHTSSSKPSNTISEGMNAANQYMPF